MRIVEVKKPPVSNPDAIPFFVRVGVTGHRDLSARDNDLLRRRTDDAITSALKLFGGSGATPLRICAVSALAEGADRILTEQILAREGNELEAILPVPAELYLEDFGSQYSRNEFIALLSLATREVAGDMSNPDHGYAWASDQMVQSVDVLIAVWDGEASRGPGGTADTIHSALAMHIPVVWVSTRDYTIVIDEGVGSINPAFSATGAVRDSRPVEGQLPIKRVRGLLGELDTYNTVPRILRFRCHDLGDEGVLGGTADDPIGIIQGRFRPTEDISQVISWIHPHYVWADRRSMFFQRWYMRGIVFLFTSSFLAVLTAALVEVFELSHWLFLVEAGFLVSIFGAVIAGRKYQMHDQWLDCRFVAERLRSLIFLKAAEIFDRRDSGNLGFDSPSESWIRYLVSYAWSHSPRLSEPMAAQSLREMLVERWTRPQIDYYIKSSKRHRARQMNFIRFSVGLLAVTIGGAVWHALGSGSVGQTLSLLAIVLPALGSTVAGISAHRQHERHATIYSRMADTLSSVQRRLEAADSNIAIRNLVWLVDDTIRSENRDWMGVMKFHNFEVAG